MNSNVREVVGGVVSEDALNVLDERFRDSRHLTVLVLGTGVALELGVGFLPIRKGGKLPIPETDLLQCALTGYTGEKKTLEVDSTRLTPGRRVLVVDDWMETAAQMEAATTLVEEAGSTVAGISVINASETERSERLADSYVLYGLNPETSLSSPE
ncbi:hypothetical protein [Haloferax sp. DFSO60]|uniref:hypothetical protein n=1 Tax=Haloferax sp. DFSO60 TaxID=3388652 RepID=UPI00397A76AD